MLQQNNISPAACTSAFPPRKCSLDVLSTPVQERACRVSGASTCSPASKKDLATYNFSRPQPTLPKHENSAPRRDNMSTAAEHPPPAPVADPVSAVEPTVVRRFKASDLPLTSATRSAIEALAHSFKKKGGYDAIRKSVWEKFEASVCHLLLLEPFFRWC